jgi:large subunit ribosomal protein LP1
MDGLSKNQKDELACSLAAMILVDGNAETSTDNIEKLLTASEIEVESYWPMMFAGFCNNNDLIAVIGTPATGGGGGGGDDAGAGGAAEEDKVEEEKEKEESEDMGGGGMGMFGDEDGGDGAY